MTAQVESMAKEFFDGKVNFFIVDVGKNRALLQSLKIKGIPSFLFMKGGTVFDKLAGSDLTKEQIRQKTDEMLAA